jgi:phosphoribosylaminoimidazole-succinocarboxamide synthase
MAVDKIQRVAAHALTHSDGSVISTDLPLPGRRSGKVRDLYDIPPEPGRSPRVLVIASDRVSAFDVVMPTPIPEKGRFLTRISLEWFRYLRTRRIVEDHLVSADPHEVPGLSRDDQEMLIGRCMVCRKVRIVPIECVVRGWLAGSGWSEYRATGTVCGIPQPPRLQAFGRLPEPIFTPAFKNDAGHDENCTIEQVADRIGMDLAERLRLLSLQVYAAAAERALDRGLILADTKFEFGFVLDADGAPTDRLVLADEVLTPDSSRYWLEASIRPGAEPASLDKQFLRDWLLAEERAGRWNRTPPGPHLPPEIVRPTRERYERAAELLAMP